MGGMSKAGGDQLDAFSQRIMRIQEGGPNTTGTIYMGAAEAGGAVITPKARRKRGSSPLSAIFFWPFAILIGALAMLAGRVAAFQLSARPEILPPDYAQLILLGADIGVAALLLIALGWAFKLGGGMRRVFLLAGFVGMMMGEGLVIQQAPDAFVPLFSQNYVSAAVSGTAPIETAAQTWEELSQSRVLMPDLSAGG